MNWFYSTLQQAMQEICRYADTHKDRANEMFESDPSKANGYRLSSWTLISDITNVQLKVNQDEDVIECGRDLDCPGKCLTDLIDQCKELMKLHPDDDQHESLEPYYEIIGYLFMHMNI